MDYFSFSNRWLAIGTGLDNYVSKTILSFDTSSIPDGAVITGAYLEVKFASNNGSDDIYDSGNNPWASNSLVIDIKNGYFGTVDLENGDWGEAGSADAIATLAQFTSGTKDSSSFSEGGLLSINKTGKTQLRLRFSVNPANSKYIFITEGIDNKLYITYTN
jgi:hypothetical protein